MANGKVDFFNDTGGYGFISTDDGDLDDDEDVFFHMEDVGGEDLTEGTEVEFDIESSPKASRRERRPTVIPRYSSLTATNNTSILGAHTLQPKLWRFQILFSCTHATGSHTRCT